MDKYIFFRNDDVRNTLDESLVQMTDLFIKQNIPVSHAVEPANVSPDVVTWLIDLKTKHSNLIEIIQHGYSHSLNYKKNIGGKLKKGEFGGSRCYQEQYDEIKKGKELMNEKFGDLWFPLFTFPYGARNWDAILAVNDNGFKTVNGSMGVSKKHKLLYTIGRLLKKEMIKGRKISWHLKNKPGTNLFQIDTSISLIKKFIDENNQCEYHNIDTLIAKSQDYIKHSNVIGYVLHHRYDNEATLAVLEKLLIWLKNQNNISFLTQKQIYEKYAK
jgi:hypothetical protein